MSQVHRLDKDTSGCLIVALSEQSAVTLTGMFRQKTAASISGRQGGSPAGEPGLQRTYWALVDGIPAKAEGIIDAPIMKVGHHSLGMCCCDRHSKGMRTHGCDRCSKGMRTHRQVL